MNERQLKILQALIDEFVESASPVGSARLLETQKFHFSGATLRNEMAALEKMGLLTHPHTSAGRTPTTQGYRLYVNKLIDHERAKKRLKKVLADQIEGRNLREARNKLWYAVNFIAETTKNLAFASIPENNQTIFLGIANVLRQPEFQMYPNAASEVLEIVEHDFHKVLENLPVEENLRIFIGEENLIPNFASCSMLAIKYSLPAGDGVLGILGPTRMDYAFNGVVLEHICSNLDNL